MHEGHSAPVGFLELFYDLVFVAATMVLSNVFSHDISWAAAGRTILMFGILWLLWFHSTVLMNVERFDDTFHRALVFAQMLLIFLSAIGYADHDIGTVEFVSFIYPVAVFLVAIGYHRLRNAEEPVRSWGIGRRNHLALAAGLVLIGDFFPDGIDWIFFSVALLLLVAPTSIHVRRLDPSAIPPVDEHHLAERAALLTLIVMGETLVKAALVITGGTLGVWDVTALVVLFVILFGIFSLYFDDVPKAGIRPGIAFGELWLLAHVVLQISIVGMAIGVSKYLQTGSTNAPDEAIVILMFAVAGIFVGFTLIAVFDRRVPRGALLTTRIFTATVAVALGFIPLNFRNVVPGTYLLELAILSVVNAVLSARIRRQTTIAPPEWFLDRGSDRAEGTQS